MYCPTCGANQANDKKFCPACGTNLAVVTAALSGQLAPATIADPLATQQANARKEMAAAIYKGAPGLGMLLGALVLAMVIPPKAAVWICFGLIIAGVSALGRGISHFYLSRAELKAAEQAAQTRLPSASVLSFPTAATSQSSSTNPLPPPSVTEQTTRHLG